MDTLITALVDGMLVPAVTLLTAPIPFLAQSGILLLLFVAAWVAVGVALARDPARLDAAWVGLRRRPLVVQAVAWLVLLPVLAGIWVWRTSWPRVARLTVIGAVAGWNLLVMLPRPA